MSAGDETFVPIFFHKDSSHTLSSSTVGVLSSVWGFGYSATEVWNYSMLNSILSLQPSPSAHSGLVEDLITFSSSRVWKETVVGNRGGRIDVVSIISHPGLDWHLAVPYFCNLRGRSHIMSAT